MGIVDYDHGAARAEKSAGPLFDEHARKEHPATSHRRAEKLSGSDKLALRTLMVLKYVAFYSGKTAAELGAIVYEDSQFLKLTDSLDRATWPHKVMKKLVDIGLVRREEEEYGLRCYITDEGENALKGM